MSVLIWTRAHADWAEDAPRLEAAKQSAATAAAFEIIRIPCLELRPLATDPLEPGVFDAAVVTSSNALQFASPSLLAVLRTCRQVYTHGEKTQSTAQSLGLSQTERIAVRTAEDLANTLASKLQRKARILIPTAATPAFDLESALKVAGLEPTIIKTYKTRVRAALADGRPPPSDFVTNAQQSWSGVVCFASPSAVDGFSAVFMLANHRLRETLTAIALGPTTKAACESRFDQVRTANHNRLEALIERAVAELRARGLCSSNDANPCEPDLNR